ncbi:uncharacterized protein [Rutidosis leptorrhynchoides]|uniref:uncharacterized protein isoform X2 n=1 Tax=Rutidosis leptorrhynchoides TaxID=125765 RepID=UPI003A9A17AB
MSRVTKWKIEKAKVKVVFRLQFHATNIPQGGWDKLFISFIPTETGKATAKTNKTNVRNGSCKWADPIYESTRLLLDSKSKQYDDKLYKLVVGTGTSRSSILGEATINLADYADASQPAVIALPLHGSDQGTILHVTIQLLTAKTGFREFEQQRDKGLQRESEISTAKLSSSVLQIPDDLVNKAKTRMQNREETNMHEEYSDSQVTCDGGSSNTSENYYIDKHDLPSTREVDSVKSSISKNQTSPTEKINGSDHSMENDLTIAYEENRRLKESLEVAESSISELKLELTALQTHANGIGKETEKITQELANEIASSQELVKEVTLLKSECSKFKNDLQHFQEEKLSPKFMEIREISDGDWVNRVSAVEDRIREMQEKVLIGVCDSDLSFLQTDLELLLSSVQDLKKGPVEPEIIVQKMDIAKGEKDNYVKKMNEMECYYEALVQELEENQKRILGEFQDLRNEHSTCVYTISTCKAETESIRNDMKALSLVNNELQKRATTSESALKRARLNYSIAVSQLQKDLDMLSFQVLSMFETNQTVIKESFIKTPKPLPKNLACGDVLSDDLKKSLSLQEVIYKKVEDELGELCSANLQMDVYSRTLKETLVESVGFVRKMSDKLRELTHQLQVSNESKGVLFEDVHSLKGQNAYYFAKCNDLHLQNQMLEADLGKLSNENFLLMEKITECEALCNDYKVYKSKHELVSVEKLNLEKDVILLKEELASLRSKIHELILSNETVQKEKDMADVSLIAARSDNQDLQKDLVSVGEELQASKIEIDNIKRKFGIGLHDTVAKMKFPNACFEKLQTQLDSVANKFISAFDSEEKHLENSESVLMYLSSLQLELQKISLEDKNFVEKSKLIISELEKENQESIERLRFLNDELDVEREMKIKLEGMLVHLTSELESQRSELDHVSKLATERELENSRVVQLIAQHEENLEKLHKDRSVDASLACRLEEMQESIISEDLKFIFVNTHYEVKIKELEKDHLESESRLIEENENLVATVKSLQMKLRDTESRLNELVDREVRCMKENETLSTTLESLRVEMEASVVRNALEVDQLKDMLTKYEAEVAQNKELQSKLLDAETRLNECIVSETRYIEENEKLSTSLEFIKRELEALNARNLAISESKNKHAIEVDQLKDMLTKYEAEVEQYKELQSKLLDAETRLNECIESETRYIEENEKLSTSLEFYKRELEALNARNLEISESKNKHALEVDQLKDALTKYEAEAEQNKELQSKLLDAETRLNECIVSETRYVEENEKLSTSLEFHKQELEALNARNLEISESKNKHILEVDQLKDMLTKYEAEVGHVNMELHDTDSRLKACLENEARYIEENRSLASELGSLRLELEASFAHNAEILESKNEHSIEVGQLKDMLTKLESDVGKYSKLETKLLDTESRLNRCLENESRYIEENKNLATKLDQSTAEVDQLKEEVKMNLLDAKEKIDHYIKGEARYIDEIKSLKSELDAVIAQNAAVLSSTNTRTIELEQNDGMISKEESDILLVVLKSKLGEQNDELIALQNKCSELTNKLSEQILKTEEFKNMSIYLKELKENGDVAREKKEPEGPSESLRLAFIKEQYQSKIQELKQQLSVSKMHNEEMLFKLQDALEEIESKKKSESTHLRRIEELQAEVNLVNSDKPDNDRIQAELECAVLSLECCKEEKEKLATLLRECEDEKSKISDELSLIRERFAAKEGTSFTGSNGSVDPVSPISVKIVQGVTKHAYEGDENSPVDDSKQLMVVNDQFRTQHLRSCMEQLDEELEKMKNDNSLLPLANYDPSIQDFHRELAQLNQVNEELGSIYPNFVDFRGNGNALERVLALEIELAEALKTKNKSSIFQSSFLKQHSDEEAVFKSFRDINELIKDMLDIKGKYTNVENELKEMHDRYSQLSLQFAEVEGERQKLMMTLKNVRSSRNLLRVNRSSLAALEDNPL